MTLLEKRLQLVMGKGGVGRTSIAVGLALAAAQRGKRVLLTEVGDPEGGYSAIGRHLGREDLTDTPERLAPGVDACRLWGSTGHELFGRSLIPAGPLVQAALRSRALRGFMMATPGAYELGIFYHLLKLLDARLPDGSLRHNYIVIDMPATGHALALARLPASVLSLMPRGPIAAAMRRGQEYLYNESVTNAWIVTLPEQLPVSESLELLEGLRATSIPIGGAIMNRIEEDPFDPDEQSALIQYLQTQPLMGQVTLGRLLKSKSEIARLVRSVRRPVIRLPEIHQSGDRAICRGLAQHIGALMEVS